MTDHAWHRILWGPCQGLKLPVPDPPAWWIRFGGYEREIAPWVCRLVRTGNLVADVGSGWGYYSAAFAKQGAFVFAADQDQDLVHLTRQVLDRNGFGGIVDHTTVRRLPRGIDAAKMDVEGAEVGILERSSTVLEEDAPELLIEVHGKASLLDCIQILNTYDYHVRKIPQRRTWARSTCNRPRGWLVAWTP